MMRSKKSDWEIWINNKEECEKSFKNYIQEGLIRAEQEKEDLSKSHLKKTDYNLNFVNNLLGQGKFYDWVIIGCYYTIYHAALSLLSIKGYSSKSHISTLCGLIYLYYAPIQNLLNKEDIELVAESSLEKQEVSYFVEAKNKRETASYGVSNEFNKTEAEKLKEKTILFINKVKKILEEN